jgi:hypothetical protein
MYVLYLGFSFYNLLLGKANIIYIASIDNIEYLNP